MMEIPVEREARPVTSLHAPMSHLQLPRRLVWLLVIVCGCAQEDAPPEQARPPGLADRPTASMTSGHQVLVDEAHYNMGFGHYLV